MSCYLTSDHPAGQFPGSNFNAFQASNEGIPSYIYADCLERLEHCGLIRSRKSKTYIRQTLYRATKAGHKLLPVLVELSYWGAHHDSKTGAPLSFVRAYERDLAGLLAALAKGYDPTKG